MALESGIYRTYDKSFVLNEDTLRRLEGVLRQHMNQYPEPLELVYRVEREDSRFFESFDLDDVLSDSNISGKRITLLQLSVRTMPNDSSNHGHAISEVAKVRFSKQTSISSYGKHVSLQIASSDKTWALLLADALEPQIERAFVIKDPPRTLILLFLISICILIFSAIRWVGITYFAIHYRTKMPSAEEVQVIAMVLMSMLFIMAISERFKWFGRLFITEAIFLIGAEVHEYPERVQLRSNITWALLAGFVVSLATSIVSMVL